MPETGWESVFLLYTSQRSKLVLFSYSNTYLARSKEALDLKSEFISASGMVDLPQE